MSVGPRSAPLLLLAMAVAACDGGRDDTDTRPPSAVAPEGTTPAPADVASDKPAIRPVPVAEPAGDAAAGAAAVAQAYYAAIEAGRPGEAWRLRWESEKAPPAAAQRFTDGFGRYRDYRATIGVLSSAAEAGGSLYVEVPIQLHGRLADGTPFGTAGTVTLRRETQPAPGPWRIFSR